MSHWESNGVSKPVYLVSPDAALATRLAQALSGVGLTLHRLPSQPDGLRTVGAALGDAVLVLDTHALRPGQTIGGLLEGLPRPPILICIAHSGDLDLRLQAVRAGARACFLAPVDTDRVAARLAALIGSDGVPHRVLVVDDEPVAAAFSAGVLQRAGIEVQVVAEALQVIDAIDAFRPDLVLMDLHMPGASGIELTSLIRDHERYARIPIVFLSVELDPGLQVAALRVGGDDFLAKPVCAERLVEVVRERISRVGRADMGSLGRDPVTGLATREVLLRRVEKAIARGAEQEAGTGLIVVEPCAPLRGPSGEAALAAIAEAARRLALPQDLLARSGENDLALLAVRADTAALDALEAALRAAVAADTGVAVSVGVARFSPASDDALTLLARGQAAARAGAGDSTSGRRDAALPLDPAARREAIAALIEAGLGGSGLELRYQPIVGLRGRPAERYEVFVRLRTPNGEYVPQAEFFAAARSSSLLGRVDQWIVERGLDALLGWRGQHPGLGLFLPQTAAGVADAAWLDWLRDQILRRDLVRCRPVLQFEAAELAGEPELLRRRFGELRRLGIGVCVSHFDLEPVGLALIDGAQVAFVRLAKGALGGDPDALAQQVAALHAAGRKVIAAGVDDPKVVPRVWRSAVDFIQGSLLQLPGPDIDFDFAEFELG